MPCLKIDLLRTYKSALELFIIKKDISSLVENVQKKTSTCLFMSLKKTGMYWKSNGSNKDSNMNKQSC